MIPGVSLQHFLVLSAALFSIGLFGVIARRNAVGVLMGLELMLNAVNLNLVAFNRYLHPAGLTGQMFTITIAAAEATVALALVVSIFRARRSVRIEDVDLLKG
jgi:NADH:ubiquinone oxidoreductase subunit K